MKSANELSFQWNLLSLNFFDLWKPYPDCSFTAMDFDLDAKRALQDFSSLHQCLKPTIWQAIWNSSPYEKEKEIIDYALDLGLRCPNGATIQCMTGLIHLVNMKSLSPGELYVHQRKIPMSFRSTRIALEKQIGMTKDLIKFLDPEIVDGSPCQIPLHEWANYMSKIPLRLTHHKVHSRNEIQRPDSNIFEVLARLNAQCSGFLSIPKVPAMPEVAPPHRPKIPALCDVEPQKKDGNSLDIDDQEPKHSNDVATCLNIFFATNDYFSIFFKLWLFFFI